MKLFKQLTACILLSIQAASHAGAQLDEANIQRGRYIAKTSGCNDCHTAGYMMQNGNIAEEHWLTGDSFGWQGPWGTTYGTNLRLFVKDMSEDSWVKTARTLKRKPPMPWFNLNAMTDQDLRSLYIFIKSLGSPGNPSPASLPPGVNPPMPYAQFPAPPKVSRLD